MIPLARSALGIVLLGACTQAASVPVEATTVYLVRHAEKMTDRGDDPPLTNAGHERAKALVPVLKAEPVDVIYATQYQRTEQTVAPVAQARKMTIERVGAGDIEGFAQRVKTDHRGQSVLAAAHSNTIPRILAALGVPEPPDIADSQYGDLFVVTLTAGGATLETRRFGP